MASREGDCRARDCPCAHHSNADSRLQNSRPPLKPACRIEWHSPIKEALFGRVCHSRATALGPNTYTIRVHIWTLVQNLPYLVRFCAPSVNVIHVSSPGTGRPNGVVTRDEGPVVYLSLPSPRVFLASSCSNHRSNRVLIHDL